MGESIRIMMPIVQAGETISALEKKALECEQAAKKQPEAAAGLKKLAMVCREWANALKSRAWLS